MESRRAYSFTKLHAINKEMVFKVSTKESTDVSDTCNKIVFKLHLQTVEAQKSHTEPPPWNTKKGGLC